MPSDSFFTADPIALVAVPFRFWYDREARFDLDPGELSVQTGRGEILLSTFYSVEDTKGSNGEEGMFFVTNLRCIWRSISNSTKNISIGYNGIQSMDVRVANLRLRGSAESLYINAKFLTGRFEFIFAYSARDLRLSSTVRSVWRAYESTRMYRELRLRSLLIRDGNLILLPGEQLFTQFGGVTNVSGDEGCLGTFFLTNVRIVWCSRHSMHLNVSIPFFHLTVLSIRPAKCGVTLAVEVSKNTGGFVFGFRIDPIHKLRELFKECTSLWKTWRAHPIIGVAIVHQENQCGDAVDVTEKGATATEVGKPDGVSANCGGGDAELFLCPEVPKLQAEDGENVVQKVATDAFAAYYADVGQKGTDRRPEYDSSIGLAVEKLRGGVTLRDLWSVVI